MTPEDKALAEMMGELGDNEIFDMIISYGERMRFNETFFVAINELMNR